MFFACLLAALLIAAFIDPRGHLVSFGSLIRWELPAVSFLIFMALATLSSMAVAFSTRLAPVVVLACCCLVFILGLVSDYLLTILSGSGPWDEICAAILPNWQFFWIYADAVGGSAVTAGYVLQASCYAALYTIGVLCLGIISFRRSDV
jgi:hypothetical protein